MLSSAVGGGRRRLTDNIFRAIIVVVAIPCYIVYQSLFKVFRHFFNNIFRLK